MFAEAAPDPSPDPEDMLAEYLVEHAYASDIDPVTDELVITVGGPAVFNTCLICGTPVTNRVDAGWTHDLGLRERNYCTIAWPGEMIDDPNT